MDRKDTLPESVIAKPAPVSLEQEGVRGAVKGNSGVHFKVSTATDASDTAESCVFWIIFLLASCTQEGAVVVVCIDGGGGCD